MKLLTNGVPFFTRRQIKAVYEKAMTLLCQDGDSFEVNLSFVDEKEIRTVNLQTRNVDRATDVLSFPTIDNPTRGKIDANLHAAEIDPETGLVPLGDVLICRQVAKRQAEEYGHGLKRELCFLALHGLLHLLGYDHVSEDDEKQMTQLQKQILDECGVKRS